MIIQITSMLKIGDQVWVFDANEHRLDYRGHWRAFPIVGETRASWLIGSIPMKVNKATMELRGVDLFGLRRQVAVSQMEVDLDVWVTAHRFEIIARVQRMAAADLVRVAEAIGYKPLLFEKPENK